MTPPTRGIPGIWIVIGVLLGLNGWTMTRPTPAPVEIVPHRVDVNTASAAEMQLLPGIGPALSRRIVEDRGRFGRFGSVEALDRVHRIGPVTVERIRPFVEIDPHGS